MPIDKAAIGGTLTFDQAQELLAAEPAFREREQALQVLLAEKEPLVLQDGTLTLRVSDAGSIVAERHAPKLLWDLRSDFDGEILAQYLSEQEADKVWSSIDPGQQQDISVYPHIPGIPSDHYASTYYHPEVRGGHIPAEIRELKDQQFAYREIAEAKYLIQLGATSYTPPPPQNYGTTVAKDHKEMEPVLARQIVEAIAPKSFFEKAIEATKITLASVFSRGSYPGSGRIGASNAASDSIATKELFGLFDQARVIADQELDVEVFLDPNRAYLGDIIAETPNFVAQLDHDELEGDGKQLFIHMKDKLDVSPAVGEIAAIRYHEGDDRAQVTAGKTAEAFQQALEAAYPKPPEPYDIPGAGRSVYTLQGDGTYKRDFIPSIPEAQMTSLLEQARLNQIGWGGSFQSPSDSNGTYDGQIVAETEHYVGQKQEDTLLLHEKPALREMGGLNHIPMIGRDAEIHYRGDLSQASYSLEPRMGIDDGPENDIRTIKAGEWDIVAPGKELRVSYGESPAGFYYSVEVAAPNWESEAYWSEPFATYWEAERAAQEQESSFRENEFATIDSSSSLASTSVKQPLSDDQNIDSTSVTNKPGRDLYRGITSRLVRELPDNPPQAFFNEIKYFAELADLADAAEPLIIGWEATEYNMYTPIYGTDAYEGRIVGESRNHVAQQTEYGEVYLHKKEAMGNIPSVGSQATIAYTAQSHDGRQVLPSFERTDGRAEEPTPVEREDTRFIIDYSTEKGTFTLRDKDTEHEIVATVPALDAHSPEAPLLAARAEKETLLDLENDLDANLPSPLLEAAREANMERTPPNETDRARDLLMVKDIARTQISPGVQITPSVEYGGPYSGEIVGITELSVVQRESDSEAIVHPRNVFEETPRIGDSLQIYHKAAGEPAKVVALENTREPDRDRGLER